MDDPASIHIDPPMKRMWNTTFVDLFGDPAARVTVRHLIYMRSGIADFEELDNDSLDRKFLLKEPNIVHSPLENF